MRRFAVVGSPIGHSLSPVLHAAAYRVLGIDDARYDAHEVGAGELQRFLEGPVGRELQGLSVTMPGKPEARALAARADAPSEALGISNTLIRLPDGGWRAENHDVHGIAASLRAHGAEAPRTAGVIGSGATALSAVLALMDMGCDELLLTARSPEKLRPALDLAEARGVRARGIDWAAAHDALEADVAVSALALQGARDLAARWEGRVLPRPGVALDVLYEPWPAPIAAALERGGTEVADGLEMLAHQADMQVRSMLDVQRAPVEAMLSAARDAVSTRR